MDKVKSNKNNSKNIIIVTLAVATALICIALTFWGNWKNNGVLTTDAFIGVMATFIGICATIIVGVQIVNHFELRRMQENIKAIEEERKEMKNQQEDFSVKMYNSRLCMENAFTVIAMLAEKEGDNALEFTAWVYSIIINNWDSSRADVLLSRYIRASELSIMVFKNQNERVDLAKELYAALAFFKVPDDIKYYEEIMKFHFTLRSLLKSVYSSNANNN